MSGGSVIKSSLESNPYGLGRDIFRDEASYGLKKPKSQKEKEANEMKKGDGAGCVDGARAIL